MTVPNSASRTRLPEQDISPRAFALGVAACVVAVGTFLLLRLDAWPPHEDETLALFVGRSSFGSLFHIVLDQRGGAPLHYVLAWAIAHTGGGLTGLRVVSALFARGEPAGSRGALGAPYRPDDRPRSDCAGLGLLGAPLPRDLRPDVQHVPLHERPLVPRTAAGARAGRATRLGALGGRRARHGRDAPLRRARARLAGALRPDSAGAGARGGVGVRGRARARDPVLAGEPRARRPLRRRRRRRRPAAGACRRAPATCARPRATSRPAGRPRSGPRSRWRPPGSTSSRGGVPAARCWSRARSERPRSRSCSRISAARPRPRRAT